MIDQDPVESARHIHSNAANIKATLTFLERRQTEQSPTAHPRSAESVISGQRVVAVLYLHLWFRVGMLRQRSEVDSRAGIWKAYRGYIWAVLVGFLEPFRSRSRLPSSSR